ncbi:hypothetical protein [Pedobacter sp.]
MKRFHLFVFASSLSLLFHSCTTYVIPGALGVDVPYKQRPMVSDSVTSAINVSGGFASSESLGAEGKTNVGILSINRGHTLKDINFSYGLLGFTGKRMKSRVVEVDNQIPNFSKNLYGFGIHTSVGHHFTSKRGNTDYRIINWENTITREFGEYLNFRKQLYGNTLYKQVLVSKSEVLWVTGLSLEIIFHHRRNKDLKHAFKLFIGGAPDLSRTFDYAIKEPNFKQIDREFNSMYFQASYFFKYKNFNLSCQADFGRQASSISLGYTF